MTDSLATIEPAAGYMKNTTTKEQTMTETHILDTKPQERTLEQAAAQLSRMIKIQRQGMSYQNESVRECQREQDRLDELLAIADAVNNARFEPASSTTERPAHERIC